MKTFILACLLALTAVSGVVVPSQPAAACVAPPPGKMVLLCSKTPLSRPCARACAGGPGMRPGPAP
jgi:hypothetical protein